MDEPLSRHYNATKVWFTAFHAALGSFIFSYNIGLFTSNQPCVAATLGWSKSDQDLYIPIMSALLPLGALFGSLGSGFFSAYIGRRQNLIIADLIIILASCLSVVPFTITFGIGRFLSGIGIGNYSILCPLYINEITPSDISGRIGSMIMLFGSLGSLFAFSFALALPTDNYHSDPMNNWWIGMFLFQGFMASIQLILFFLMFPHETASWLLNKGMKDKALESLAYIYERTYAENLIQKMQYSPSVNDKTEDQAVTYDFTYKQMLTCAAGTTKSMRLGLLLMIISQFAGINAILFYATTIFSKFGSGTFIARVFTFLSGVVKLVAVFGLIPLIDSVGRKKVLICGCIGMGIALGMMAVFSVVEVYFIVPFLCIEIYLALFVISIGPISWVYAADILPSRAMSICTGANWFSATMVVLFFPIVVKIIGLMYTFGFFAFVNVVGAGYFALDMIETKGMMKTDIRALFATKR